MNFRVGQKVVCVDDDWYGPDDLPLAMLDYVKSVPIKGAVYRVRSINVEGPAPAPPYIRLSEIVNPRPPAPKDEVEWRANCFRPVVESEADISIFTKMLTPNIERVDG